MAQPQLAQHRRHAPRLVRVGRQRAAGRHVAELARAGADAAQDHDGQRAAVPALADVRARGALADGVQPELGDALLEVEEDLAARHLHANPVGLGLELRALGGRAFGLAFGLQDAQLARAGFDDPVRHLRCLDFTRSAAFRPLRAPMTLFLGREIADRAAGDRRDVRRGDGVLGGFRHGAAGDGGAAGGSALDAGAVVDTGLGPWTAAGDGAAPVPLDDVTVYAFSQTNGEEDPQVAVLAPDMNIRAWQRWDRIGATSDFSAPYLADAHAAGTRLVGGTTATALFPDEVANPQFPPVPFDDLDDARRIRRAGGSFADPAEHASRLAGPPGVPRLPGPALREPDRSRDGRALLRRDQRRLPGGHLSTTTRGSTPPTWPTSTPICCGGFPGADYQSMFGMTPTTC